MQVLALLTYNISSATGYITARKNNTSQDSFYFIFFACDAKPVPPESGSTKPVWIETNCFGNGIVAKAKELSCSNAQI